MFELLLKSLAKKVTDEFKYFKGVFAKEVPSTIYVEHDAASPANIIAQNKIRELSKLVEKTAEDLLKKADIVLTAAQEARLESNELRNPADLHKAEQEIKVFYDANPQIKNTLSDAWIQTYTGRKFFPLNPRVEDICIEDIAHALSNICRFTGHCRYHYSVAQHSVLVSYVVSAQHSLHALLHDGSEFALNDIARPVKQQPEFAEYRRCEARLQSLIYQAFGLDSEEPAEVREADTRMLVTEARDLMSPVHPEWKNSAQPYPFVIVPLSPTEAKKLFMDRFLELTSDKNGIDK